MVERKSTIYEANSMVEVIVEELDGNPYIHVEVKTRMSKALMEYLTSLWDLLRIDLYLQGYEYVFSYNANEKFGRMFKGDWKIADGDYPVMYSKLEM